MFTVLYTKEDVQRLVAEMSVYKAVRIDYKQVAEKVAENLEVEMVTLEDLCEAINKILKDI